MESLSDFLKRTDSFIWDSLPHDGGMEANNNLAAKVFGDGRLAPYAGSTVVFKLPEYGKHYVGEIQDLLYQNCADMLAARLDPDTFHITLHDLVSGTPGDELTERIRAVRDCATEQTGRLASGNEIIRLRSTALFNMVRTSIVLGFAPVDDYSCMKLMDWHESFQKIVRLDYPLTPHVTVAYFRPCAMTSEQLYVLRAVIERVNQQEKLTVELLANTMEYQEFSDMNHYWRVEPLPTFS